MWKKIIEKMYDPKDFEVLMGRFVEIIEDRKQRIRMGMGNSKYLMTESQQLLLPAAKQKMTREELILLNQSKDSYSKIAFQDFQKTILDF